MQSIEARPAPVPRNGVDTPALFATINAVKGQPELAKFQFRALEPLGRAAPTAGAGSSRSRAPAASTRTRASFSTTPTTRRCSSAASGGPTPVEFLLHALAACLTAGIAQHRRRARRHAHRGPARPSRATSTCAGILGLSNEVRNGYQGIRVQLRIKGDAPAEKLREIVEQSGPARRCSTCSPTAPRGRCGRRRLSDARRGRRGRRPPPARRTDSRRSSCCDGHGRHRCGTGGARDEPLPARARHRARRARARPRGRALAHASAGTRCGC